MKTFVDPLERRLKSIDCGVQQEDKDGIHSSNLCRTFY